MVLIVPSGNVTTSGITPEHITSSNGSITMFKQEDNASSPFNIPNSDTLNYTVSVLYSINSSYLFSPELRDVTLEDVPTSI